MAYVTTKAFNGFGQGLGQVPQHLEMPGESGQKPVNLSCPSPSTIKMIQATYGSNCNKPELMGNKTSVFQMACDGQPRCTGITQENNASDPAWGCPKAFTADWQCIAPPVIQPVQTPMIQSLPPMNIVAPVMPTQTLPMPVSYAPTSAPSSSSSLILLGGMILALVAIVFIIIKRKKKKAATQVTPAVTSATPAKKKRKK